MTPRQLRESFVERPEFLLALMLSTPAAPTTTGIPSVTIDFSENEVIAKVKHPEQGSRALRLLATKQTIFAGVLLHHLIDRRGPEFAASLIGRTEEFATSAAVHNAEFRPRSVHQET